MLTEAEKRRYNRHIMLPEVGEEGQEKLKRSKVLVVGAGGLGAPNLQYLTAAGIGELSIMDDDLVNEDNLHRQILYGGHDLGKLKTIIAKERLNTLNPFIKHHVINIRLNSGNALRVIKEYDLVIDATDNFSTRYLINDACIILGKPWIYGSVYQYEGEVSVFNYKNGPSIRCLFEHVEDKKNIPNPADSGLFGILPGIIGSFQANEAIKVITGIGEALSGKLLYFNTLNNNSRLISFPRIDKNFQISSIPNTY